MTEHEPNPLVGLTEAQADAHIDRYAAKVEAAEASVKAQKAHLKDLRQARRDLPAVEPGGNGTRAQAASAEGTVTAGDED
jgi:hypothetical protein